MTDCLGSASSFPVKFSATKRRGFQVDGDIQRCCRFGSPSACGWSYTGSTDAISFSVDKDIVLHGVCFFGNENKAYSVDLKVNDTLSVLVSKTGQFFSKLLQVENCSYYGFKVNFDKEKVILKKNTKYDMKAKISGSPSLRGVNCVSSVQCSDVTFTFMTSDYPNNGTDVSEGQFPELLFSL
ncbi:BTB/POZ domain-containing protein 2-like [Oculina patagonica]